MKYLLILITLLLCCGLIPAAAQDVATIEYGQTVTGEISNRFFEIEYRFSGSKGDVILADLQAAEESGTLGSPAVILLNADYEVLASLDGYARSVKFFAELPYSGEYSLLVTRKDGRAGDSVGEYVLNFSQLPILDAGKLLTGKITDNSVDYYVVKMSSTFSVAYERLTRGIYPEIRIAVLREDNSLWQVARLSGETLVSGSIGIAPEISEVQVYIVSVETGYGPEETTVEYTLELQ